MFLPKKSAKENFQLSNDVTFSCQWNRERGKTDGGAHASEICTP